LLLLRPSHHFPKSSSILSSSNSLVWLVWVFYKFIHKTLCVWLIPLYKVFEVHSYHCMYQ
jgi:hypothetical protein